jgi:sec-independent protein translocase protein TatC
MEEEKHMSFLEHLEELRWRLVRAAIAVLVISSVLFIYQEWIMENLFLSMNKKGFITFQLMCDYFGICIEEIPLKMQSMTMGGQFSYALMMSFMGGFVIAFPYFFYQLWSFVKPGLKLNEINATKGIVFYVSLLFFSGIVFGLFIPVIIYKIAIKFKMAWLFSLDHQEKIQNNKLVHHP